MAGTAPRALLQDTDIAKDGLLHCTAGQPQDSRTQKGVNSSPLQLVPPNWYCPVQWFLLKINELDEIKFDIHLHWLPLKGSVTMRG